ncbi:hypothetical protein L697_06275 [Streptococcus oralis subsp. tigurinus 2425]|nr:hypothetical protein L697_06275 [Streptococcus oralis subsp. tigurinus 2425]
MRILLLLTVNSHMLLEEKVKMESEDILILMKNF